MPRVRLLVGKHGQFAQGQRVLRRKGDEFDVTEAEAEVLAEKGRIQVLGAAAAPAGDGEGDEFPELAGNVAEVRAAVAEMEDIDELEALAEAEAAGKNRTGVLTAINERIEDLARG